MTSRRGSRCASTASVGCRSTSPRSQPRARPADQQAPPSEDVAVPNPPPPPQPPPDIEVVTDQERGTGRRAGRGRRRRRRRRGGRRIRVAGGRRRRRRGRRSAVGVRGIVLAWKARRLQRRRTAGRAAVRIAGAWSEVTDRYAEVGGRRSPSRATPLETARTYLDAEPSATQVRGELFGLVAAVDRAAYDAADPDEQDAAQAWGYCRTVVGALDAGRSRWQRLRMRLDPRPLLRRSPRPAGAARRAAPPPAPPAAQVDPVVPPGATPA